MVKDPRLPNFFILGAAKCGTTSLYYYLKQHPQIYLPKHKEPHFFDNDTFWNEGLETYLRRHFKGAERYPARGEATPAYFHRPEKVIPRMKQIYGDESPKFILVFRNPVERAFSHYLHRVRNRTETETFERALELEKERLANEPDLWVGYFSDGLYAKQLTEWLKVWPRERFFFALTEDLKDDPLSLVKKVFEFLGVDSRVKVEVSIRRNVASEPRFPWLMDFLSRPSRLKRPIGLILSPYVKRKLKWLLRKANLKPVQQRPKLDPNIAAKLKTQYRNDIEKLAQLIGRDLSHWLDS